MNTTVKLSGSEIGNFKTKEQLNNYKEMLSVKDPIEAMSRDIVTLDDNPEQSHPVYGKDYNFNRPGNVLLNNGHLEGTLEFAPDTKEVQNMTVTRGTNSTCRYEQYEFTETEDKKIYSHTKTKDVYPFVLEKTGKTLSIDKKTNDMELTFINETIRM